MVTKNGNLRLPPPGESDIPGRRRVPHPPRLDSLKIDPRASRTTKPAPRSSPRSLHSSRPPGSRSPKPPVAHHSSDERLYPVQTRQFPSQGSRDEWKRNRSPSRPPYTTPDPHNPKWPSRDSEIERTNHRRAPPPRGGMRVSMSTSRLNNWRPRGYDSPDRRPQELTSHGLPLPRFPSNGPADENTPRSSVNSTMTSRSSIEQASGTERSSVLTKSSSIIDLSPDTPNAPYGMEGDMSVEDAISMYLDGFSDVTEEPASPKSRADSKAPSVTPPPSRDAHVAEICPPEVTPLDDIPPIPPLPESTLPESTKLAAVQSDPPLKLIPPAPTQTDIPPSESTPPDLVPTGPSVLENEPPELMPSQTPLTDLQSMHQRQQSKVILTGPVPPPLLSGMDSRDNYGFRKATQYVTLPQYETWKGPYSNYAAHRRFKWYELLKEHGLSTTDPVQFPPQSSKTKRFVRKGIPSEFRGAAWFWYAGGFKLLTRNRGHYDQLVERAMNSPSNDDKEHIERDLHRTFPDNLHFKPETADAPTGSSNPQNQDVPTETQMIRSLRRVLYAFALHNPKVGYTQSLNFITGMLLLFLPEEKAFWMLHIVTSVYLPGTHEISLEGANIDLWVLMVLLKDSMPNIYAKIASMGDSPAGRNKTPALGVHSRLPDITLGLTNWLMSVFIGTLPLETTLRVWDVFFYEGSKTFFRVSLGIFKACEREILKVSDPMEVFQVVQTIPKKLLDANSLLDECFVRRHRVGQGRIDELRASRGAAVRQEKLRRSVAFSKGEIKPATDDFPVRRRTPIPGIEHRVVDSWRQLKQHAFRDR
ncbi:hypothetical protein NUU61_003272 [Penicillium alfredii]|uniref:Rab-GAP TBC domain-containing protein n=1 Tax=Penicillium alfredii TaxID=1506179 RepID=A0A9W9FT50_9EURO|nr:uncharacterized protein NUU61_003272 [Penicillium alfredii]KAJ5105925.1 hypothetical protein NUU61_003272 [Penicillium alfredii]